jgi:transposase
VRPATEAGEVRYDPGVLSDVQRQTAAVAAERRRAMLRLIAQGMSRAEIRKRLGITKQRVGLLLRRVPRDELDAARA